jgi:hypothetical protein
MTGCEIVKIKMIFLPSIHFGRLEKIFMSATAARRAARAARQEGAAS